jgi:hypothetical protein
MTTRGAPPREGFGRAIQAFVKLPGQAPAA